MVDGGYMTEGTSEHKEWTISQHIIAASYITHYVY